LTNDQSRHLLTVLGALAEFEKELIRALVRQPKLTEHQKREAIKPRDHLGEPVREIARSYNVNPSPRRNPCRGYCRLLTPDGDGRGRHG